MVYTVVRICTSGVNEQGCQLKAEYDKGARSMVWLGLSKDAVSGSDFIASNARVIGE
jgi:hypothetical protein